MKQELEKLGFIYNDAWKYYTKYDDRYIIQIENEEVYLRSLGNIIHLFPYNHEKLKQLIEILK